MEFKGYCSMMGLPRGTTPEDIKLAHRRLARKYHLDVKIFPYPLYRTDHSDVWMDLPVAPWEAALGTLVEAPTPTGQLEIRIPVGTAHGRKLHVKGRGCRARAQVTSFLCSNWCCQPPLKPAASARWLTKVFCSTAAMRPEAGVLPDCTCAAPERPRACNVIRVSTSGAALALDLLDELERLRVQLHAVARPGQLMSIRAENVLKVSVCHF